MRASGVIAKASEVHSVGFWIDLICLMLLAAMGLTACGNAPSVPSEILLAVVAALKGAKELKFSLADFKNNESKGEANGKTRISGDRHKGFFAYRRAEVLGIAHDAWLKESGYTTLKSRVLADFEEVKSFADEKLSETALGAAAPDGPASTASDGSIICDPSKHLDLVAVAKPLVSAASPSVTSEGYQAFRLRAARSIIWRAAALEPSLWDETSPNQRLRRKALQEVLDRRLRFVERMHMQVNANAGSLKRASSGTNHGPWVDDARLRIFEYPFINKDAVSSSTSLENLIQPRQSYWHVNRDKNGIAVSLDYAYTARIDNEPDALSAAWQNLGSDGYSRYFNVSGPKSLTAAVDDLMKASTDYWKRNWVYCDHVCATLHLDALRFALSRQSPPGDFNAVNSSPSSSALLPIRIGAELGQMPTDLDDPVVTDRNELLCDGDNAVWFENRFVPIEKLQVGDHVIFWNHLLYLAFYSGAWRLENSVLTSLESNPMNGGIMPLDLELEGDGMSPMTSQGTERPGLTAFAKEMSEDMNKGMNTLREMVKWFEAGGLYDPFFLKQTYVVFRWKPYPGINIGANSEGPWFVYLPRKFNGVDYWGSVDVMLKTIYNSVIGDPDPIDGYVKPPSSVKIGDQSYDIDDGVFYPLYLPKVPSSSKQMWSWRQYFMHLHKDPSLTVDLLPFPIWAPDPDELKKKHEDAPDYNPEAYELTGAIPALFLGGNRFLPVQVLRPKARAV